MITIHSVTADGAFNTRLWDNKSCNFFTEDGEKIDVDVSLSEEEIKAMDKAKAEAEESCRNRDAAASNERGDNLAEHEASARECYSRSKYSLTQATKSKNLCTIKIQMGLACNFTCQYCKQTAHKSLDPHANLEDARRFIEKFPVFCTTDRKEPIRIELWGGEPLVYWETLQLLGEYFRNEFPNARITVLSNGSLVTKEKIDWFIKHKIVLAVSHDGPGQLDYRSGDPLADGSDTLEALRYYADNASEPLYFNAVITKGRYDLPGIITFIKSKFSDPAKVQVGFEGIVLIEDEAQFDAKTMFTQEDYLELRREIVGHLVNGRINEVSVMKHKVQSMMQFITSDKFHLDDNIQQKCSMDSPFNVSVSLKGDVLACHSTPRVIGTIDNFEEANLGVIGFTHWHSRPECLSCPVLPICRGGCLAQDAVAFYHTCNNEFQYHMIFFETVFQLLFGEAIIAMEGIQRPTKEIFIERYKELAA